MAPIQKHISSFTEENSERATKTFTASSCFNSTRTSTSSNSITGSDSAIASNRVNSSNHISHFDREGEREVALPITSRGHFYHDSFFKDLRDHFDNAVKDTLDLWDSRSPFEDDLLSYRRMRDLNLTEETQALSVKQDDSSHQVVIDVRDFMDGDIKVKVVDDSELVIEGSVEKRQDGSVSKSTFCRRFSFPGLLSEDTVSSSMSADGVLTVTVPKKTSLTNKEGRTIKINTSHKNSTDAINTHKNFTNNVEAKQVSVEEKSSRVKVQEDQAQSTESQSTQASSDSTEATPLASFHLLPISERGPFFRDSFFQDTRQQFQQAVDQVLKEWGQLDSASDHMDMYRNLRKHNLQEENQAVAFSEDHKCYKIVVDVQDFKEGDVKVKVVDENELTIEGNLESKQDDSVSSKSFFRRFCFPGLVSADTVRSGMSSDGILTVTVPKTTSGSKFSAVSEASKSQISQTSSQKTEEQETLTKQSKSEQHKLHSEFLNACAKRTEATSSLANNIISEEKQEKGAHSKFCESGTSLLENIQSSKDTVGDQCLSISSKGQFFSDSFFEDVRKDFETAISEVLSRHDIMRSANDEFSSYRSLRERELKDETQAMKTTEDQNGYKVVLDVHDFLNEDVKVKVVDNKEVVVEGRAEKSDGTSRSSKSFCRRFTFPGAVDMNAVTSAMSSDGVLTISAPKASTNSS
ncbi:uncharacterized protein LOC125028831 [Penaeus chinensis]|uniref:uncharacterized protein LOC125028831 n=1 Tax=Penaeus chinensis TaxID=139456 RepID=UPI001FB5AD71|nr:uncharacterized protein LOC125028831 [Penaeus chinensis]XP_047474320.1 uncharacterized protein LOC125028831 [Penaeus chinensis]